MNKIILLAVDTTSHTAAAAEMTRDLAASTGGRVIVMHVHEYAIGRFGRIKVDCGEGEGERVVTDIVDRLTAAGIAAEGDIRKVLVGGIARKISDVAGELDARMIILGSSSSHDLPWLPFGSVSLRLLHQSRKPVLIVPMAPAPAADYIAAPQASVFASATS
jgi:nucleotide-binding universal stress UspA family protein